MPHHNPQNAEEAGYISFALFEALTDMLVVDSVLSREDIKNVLRTAAARLQHAPNNASARSSDFIRHTMLGEK